MSAVWSGARALIVVVWAAATLSLIAMGSGASDTLKTTMGDWSASEWQIAAGATLSLIALVSAIAGLLARRHWAGPMAVVGLALLTTGAGVAAWVYQDGKTDAPASDSVKAGVLIAGALGAGITLFINDRRRVIETSKAETERSRLEQDRLRTEDERFARAVEMLGHEVPEVRVGALHALTQMAITHNSGKAGDPHRVQAALDVVCAYLRHDRTARAGLTQNGATDEAAVRQTALDAVLRLARTLAPHEGENPYLINLRGATLFKLMSRRATLVTHIDLSDAIVLGEVDLDGARLAGGFLCARTRFRGAVSLNDATFSRHATFVRARFENDADFSRSRFDARADFRSAVFQAPLRLPHATFAQPAVFRGSASRKWLTSPIVTSPQMPHSDARSSLDQSRIHKLTSMRRRRLTGPTLPGRATCSGELSS